MQATTWYPAQQAHLVFVGPDLVVLDVADNAYFCIAQATGAIHQAGDGRLDFNDPELAQQFAAAGLISPSSAPAQERSSLPSRPNADLQSRAAPPARHGDRVVMAWVFAGMVRHYFGRPFSHLITTARRGARGLEVATSPPSPMIAQRAAAFAQLLPWTPFQGECLFRSFMLLRFLRLSGEDAQWVFGVRTWPFQAHCWLQVGDTVLDDSADHVAPFTPIFAV